MTSNPPVQFGPLWVRYIYHHVPRQYKIQRAIRQTWCAEEEERLRLSELKFATINSFYSEAGVPGICHCVWQQPQIRCAHRYRKSKIEINLNWVSIIMIKTTICKYSFKSERIVDIKCVIPFCCHVKSFDSIWTLNFNSISSTNFKKACFF